MGTDRFELPDIQAVASLHAGAARPPAVEVEYEGTVPPLELFSHLAALGFGGLVPQPPPSSSIDWSVGDGRSPTIRPYRAMASGLFDGPADEREAALAAARMVLRRLSEAARTEQVAVGQNVATPSFAAAPPAPLARTGARPDLPPPPTGAVLPRRDETVTPLRAVAPMASVPAPAPAPEEQVAVRSLAVVIDAASAADLRSLLERFGTVVDEVPVTWSEEMTYRGQKTETHHRAVRFHATVGRDVADQLLASLSRVRLRAVEVRD